MQFDALKKEGANIHNKIFEIFNSRSDYIKMISQLQADNIVVVRGIEGLGRGTYELIKLVVGWKENGSRLSEDINISTRWVDSGI